MILLHLINLKQQNLFKTTEPNGNSITVSFTPKEDGTFNYNKTSLTPNTNYTFDFWVTNSVGTTYKTIRQSTMKDKNENNFKVYPNPSNGRFNVETDISTPNNRVKIFDITGKLVYTTIIQDVKTEIDLTDKQLKSVYIMTVYNKIGELINKEKLLIND